MTGDIWDIYQQIQPGGWTPPPGIEGQPGGGFVTSGNKAWQDAQNPTPKQPNQPPAPQSPSMPAWAQDINNWAQGMMGQFQNQGGQSMAKSNFPNAYSDFTDAQRESMALAQARQTMNPQQFQSQFPNAVPQGGRKTSGYTTYQLPSGGTAQLPIGSPLPSGYQNATPYVPPRDAAQQFDLNQSYAQGYGAPNPTIQQGAGGPYRVAGGVAKPISFPNVFQRVGNDIATLGRGIGYGAGAIGNFAMNQFNNLFNRPQQQPSYANTGPRRYFDY